MDYWEAKPHAQQKYHILGKYLAACGRFARKYGNFAYIDTHGGSGVIEMKEEAPLLGVSTHHTDGSPLIAARAIEAWGGGKQFPCHIIEIDAGKYDTLQQSTADFPWVHTHQGDCNVLLPQVFKTISAGAFVLCFVDPDGLVYHGPGGPVRQFAWPTMQRIAARRKVEVLLTLPLEAIVRTSGYCRKRDDVTSQVMRQHLTTYFGCEDWRGLTGKRQFLDLYLNRLRWLRFGYVGAYYVCYGQLPLYYLVYATRNETGARIMRDVMHAEWHAAHPRWAQEAALAGQEHPLSGFVFDNEGVVVGDYPPDWEEIASKAKEEANWSCEECGHPHDPDPSIGYTLTVYHLDGNPANCARQNLRVFCQRCHLRAQAKLQLQGQRIPADGAHQLALFPEES